MPFRSNSEPSSRPVVLGTALTILAAIGFSAKAVIIKLIYARTPIEPITMMSVRMAMALPFYLIVAVRAGYGRAQPLTRREVVSVAALGFVGYYLASLADFLGLQYVSAGLERLVLYLYPTLVVLASSLMDRRRITRREVLALTLSYVGIALVVAEDVALNSQVALGALFVLASAVAFAVFMLGAGRLIPRLGSARFTAYAMTVACGATLAHFGAVATPDALDLPLFVYSLLAVMALFSTVVPTFLMSAAVRRLGAERAAMMGFIGPVLTIALGYVLLGEEPSAVQWIGTLFVLGGVTTISMAKSR